MKITLIPLGNTEAARLDVDTGEPELTIFDQGGVSPDVYYPPAAIVLRGAENLRRLADLLAPYATPVKRWLPSTAEQMVLSAAGSKCACPQDGSETCWRCVAQHVLSQSAPSK